MNNNEDDEKNDMEPLDMAEAAPDRDSGDDMYGRSNVTDYGNDDE